MRQIITAIIVLLLSIGFVTPALAENPPPGQDPSEGPCVLESIPDAAYQDDDILRYQQEVGPDEVYFPLTGHHLEGDFLDYWRANGGLYQFGYPLTEEITEDGMTVQYFERAVFEFHADHAPEWQVLLRRLGADQTAHRRNEPAFLPISGSDGEDTRFFPETGHRLSHGFKDYWEQYGGLRINGYPISEEFTEDGRTVQYFERVRYEWHPEHQGTQYEILLGHLGRVASSEAGVNTSPVERRDGIENYHPDLWYTPAPPAPTPPAVSAPAGAPTHVSKWIELDLTNQRLRAWQYDRVVFNAVVSTGRPAVPTLTGTFQTYMHLRYGNMAGWTPDRGSYSLPNVPYIMYYDRGYGIHGTYWHTNFGTPQSAGCVNMTIGDAGWLFNWAHVGTTVYIHGRTPGT